MVIKNSKLNVLVALIMLGLVGLSTSTEAQTKARLLGSQTTTTQASTLQPTNPWRAGFQTSFAKPLDELAASNYRNGGGVALEIFTPSLLKSTGLFNVQLGVHLDYMRSGTEAQDINLPEYGTDPVQYRARNQSSGLHLIGRLTTKEMGVMPYLDGFIGSRFFFSTSSVLIEEDPECPHFETDFLTNNLTFVYGGSIGTMVKVNYNTRLDFRLTYSQGSAADFINLDNFEADLNANPMTASHTQRDSDIAPDPDTTTPTPLSNPEHTIHKRINTPLLFFSAGIVFDL